MTERPNPKKWSETRNRELTLEELFQLIGDVEWNLKDYIWELKQEVEKLTIQPEEPRKSIEEITQELDEKFDALIKTTKEKFECSNYFAGKRYNEKFDRIIENFEYAKEHGHFPLKLTFNCDGNISLGTSYPTANLEITSNFVIKPNTIGAGYWDVKPNIQIWLQVKPNWLVRKCAKIFFDFGWKDG